MQSLAGHIGRSYRQSLAGHTTVATRQSPLPLCASLNTQICSHFVHPIWQRAALRTSRMLYSCMCRSRGGRRSHQNEMTHAGGGQCRSATNVEQAVHPGVREAHDVDGLMPDNAHSCARMRMFYAHLACLVARCTANQNLTRCCAGKICVPAVSTGPQLPPHVDQQRQQVRQQGAFRALYCSTSCRAQRRVRGQAANKGALEASWS